MSADARPEAKGLEIDVAQVARDIAEPHRRAGCAAFKRRGAIVGLSGGIDSSVTAALCVQGARPRSRDRTAHARAGVFTEQRGAWATRGAVAGNPNICGRNHAAARRLGCYARRDDGDPRVVPGVRRRLALQGRAAGGLTAEAYSLRQSWSSGRRPARRQRVRLTADALPRPSSPRATSSSAPARCWSTTTPIGFKYAVAGTPNRLEYEQGFFVKNGDGAADFKPIAHLYKAQVYQLAAHLGVPEEIRRRPPTTDTYSLRAVPGGVLLHAAYSSRWTCACWDSRQAIRPKPWRQPPG